jgi:arabinose-5-phosphate isomerase
MYKQELLDVAKNVLQDEILALQSAQHSLGEGFVDALVLLEKFGASGRVVVMGMGKSGHVANKIAATLASTGTPAFFVHPAEAGHGDLGMITAADIVLAISQSGKSDELLRLLPYFKRNAIPLVAMTGDVQSPLAVHADAIISTAVTREACPLGLAPTASTTLALALGDAIAICLLKSKGFTAEEFATTHPHGTLGRRLLVTIGDVMFRDDAVPRVRLGTSVRAAICEMSRAGLGFVSVIDDEKHLVGIFTDGDLRRALDNDTDIKATSIENVMSSSCVVAKPYQLAVEAVELMESRKISCIPIVCEANMLIGAVNMRLLLQAGVV